MMTLDELKATLRCIRCPDDFCSRARIKQIAAARVCYETCIKIRDAFSAAGDPGWIVTAGGRRFDAEWWHHAAEPACVDDAIVLAMLEPDGKIVPGYFPIQCQILHPGRRVGIEFSAYYAFVESAFFYNPSINASKSMIAYAAQRELRVPVPSVVDWPRGKPSAIAAGRSPFVRRVIEHRAWLSMMHAGHERLDRESRDRASAGHGAE